MFDVFRGSFEGVELGILGVEVRMAVDNLEVVEIAGRSRHNLWYYLRGTFQRNRGRQERNNRYYCYFCKANEK